jgi:hypothetical protein
MSEGTFESDAGDVDGHVTEPVTDDGELEAVGGPTEAGPTESGDEQEQTQGNALDDVDLEPPSS